MAKPSDLTAEAIQGYGRALDANPYLYSSNSYNAFELGAYFARSGRPAPRDVRSGRGDSIRGNDMRFKFKGSPATGLSFERVE